MRDIGLVAAFEVMRAIRTWRAAALLAITAVASGGATWMFCRFVGTLENTLARQLGVARADRPGTMLNELVRSGMWRDVLEGMSGSPHLVDRLVEIPPLALFHQWFTFLVVPVFAASAAAECVSIDVQSRAVRYELLRTGRFELAFGRFVGQLALTAGATGLAAVVGYAVGLALLVGQSPGPLAVAYLESVPRSFVFGVPFVAIGVAASLWTRSPAWSRVIAVTLATATWVVDGFVSWLERPLLIDLGRPLLPQGWLRGLWEPGLGYWPSAGACIGLAVAVLGLGFVRFAKRDL